MGGIVENQSTLFFEVFTVAPPIGPKHDAQKGQKTSDSDKRAQQSQIHEGMTNRITNYLIAVPSICR